ncbi:MAG: type II toxin-antitoxin system VapC family toxin [Dongiaceae bacterium]
MTGILVDTNVLLDLVTDAPEWADWSQRQLETWALRGPLLINPVIYAETSVGFERIEELEAVLSETGIAMAEIPRPALFLAGKAFRAYKRKGGSRTGVLPDFFIGAHAAVARLPLLSRDVGRYRTYFPTLEVVAPER